MSPEAHRDKPAKANGKTPAVSVVTVSLEEPRQLLDEGRYTATCTAATVAWSRRWKKWIARLVMDPSDYTGRPYTGSLCKFLQLTEFELFNKPAKVGDRDSPLPHVAA